MASVQAAVLAGLGVSIVSQSSVVPGMQVVRGRAWPDTGALEAGVVKGAGARDEIVAALASVVREALAVIDASRRRA
jgi:DNA-binding transcriptional LysR family regulator